MTSLTTLWTIENIVKIEESGQGPQTGSRKPSLCRTSAQRTGVHVWLDGPFRAEMMDFMTVRHSNNDVLDDAVHDRNPYERDRGSIRALKQGPGNPPSAGQVPETPAFMVLSLSYIVLK